MTFAIPFSYTVAPESRAAFEAVYGPDGRWARFFRTDEHYVETTLERNAARYEALSRARARLYLTERRLPPT